MILDIDPKVDIAFKKLFGNEDEAPLLVSLLNAVTEPDHSVSGITILPAQSRQESPQDKQVIGDVRARDQGYRQFHVEMQWRMPWFFPKRMLYYWGKFHAEELRKGEDYQVLRPTLLVCFVNDVVYQDVADYHLVFQVREARHGLVFCDDLVVHLIQLPRFTRPVEELSSALDRWLYFLRHGAELDTEALPAALNVPEIRRAMEVLMKFSQDEIERWAYEDRLKALRDQSSLLREVHEAREAAQRGEQRGRLLGQIQLCQELLNQPQTPEAELAALSLEDLTALLAQLRKQGLPGHG
jgi:predicted transposase/invertase (TIGR01784 family)